MHLLALLQSYPLIQPPIKDITFELFPWIVSNVHSSEWEEIKVNSNLLLAVVPFSSFPQEILYKSKVSLFLSTLQSVIKG